MSGPFADDLWDRFDAVVNRVKAGATMAENVQAFLKKRSQIEKTYASALEKLARDKSHLKDLEIGGSASEAWKSVLDQTEAVAVAHQSFSDQLGTLSDPLGNWIKESSKTRSTLLKNGERLQKTLQTGEGNLVKAKGEFEKAKEAQEASESEYNASAGTKNESKAKKKFEGDTKKAQQADKKYAEAVTALQQIQDRYYKDEMPKILAEMQTCEEERIDQVKECLEAMVSQYERVAPEVTNCIEKMKDAIGEIDRSQDIQSFVDQTKTGNSKPDPVEYEGYSGSGSSAAASVPASSPKAVSSPPPSSTPAPKQSAPPSSAPPSVPKQAAVARAPSVGVGSAPAAEFVVALFDYAAQEDGELEFSAGAKIKVLSKDSSGWWQGEINGRTGTFPMNFVEAAPAAAAPAAAPAAPAAAAKAPPKAAGPPVRKCRALYTYSAEDEGELTIEEGDIITVESEDEGWYFGKNEKGKSGRYPSNYVEML